MNCKGKTKLATIFATATVLFAVSTTSRAEAAPVITSVGGMSSTSAGITNGVVSMDCGRNYNGKRVINDATGTYLWQIYGTGFGSAKPTVKIGGASATVTYWSNTSITAHPTIPWFAQPVPSTTLEVTTSTGQKATSPVSTVPAISTRIYGQCTWHVAKRRREMGKLPSPYAYSGHTPITYNYTPMVGDQVNWNFRHVGIIEYVSAPAIIGSKKRWLVTISEVNADCNNGYRTYQSTFEVDTVARTVTQGIKSSATSLGGATQYYR